MKPAYVFISLVLLIWALVVSYLWIDSRIRLGYAVQALEGLKRASVTLARLAPSDTNSTDLQQSAKSNGLTFKSNSMDMYRPIPLLL